MLVVDVDVYQELCERAAENTAKNDLFQFTVQDMIRSIIDSYLTSLRGPSQRTVARMSAMPNISFKIEPCPQCNLWIDKTGFPTLIEKGDAWFCHMCGASGKIGHKE